MYKLIDICKFLTIIDIFLNIFALRGYSYDRQNKNRIKSNIFVRIYSVLLIWTLLVAFISSEYFALKNPNASLINLFQTAIIFLTICLTMYRVNCNDLIVRIYKNIQYFDTKCKDVHEIRSQSFYIRLFLFSFIITMCMGPIFLYFFLDYSYFKHNVLKMICILFSYLNLLRFIFILVLIQIRFKYLKNELANMAEYQPEYNCVSFVDRKQPRKPVIVTAFHKGTVGILLNELFHRITLKSV